MKAPAMLGIGRVSPALEWEHSSNGHLVLTARAIVKPSYDYGFRSPSVGSMALNPRALSQCCPKLAPTLQNSLTPVAKHSPDCFGQSGKLGMHSRCYLQCFYILHMLI